MATLGTQKSGHCREVETSECMDCREVAVSGGSTVMPKIVKTQNNIPTPQYKSESTVYSPTPRNPTLSSMGTEALPVGGGSHVARLNVKTSCVCVYKCLSLIVGFAIVAISLYTLSLLFGPCRLSEFTLAGPQYRYYFSTVNHHNFISSTPAQMWFKHKDCTHKHSASNNIFVLIKACFSWCMKSDLVTTDLGEVAFLRCAHLHQKRWWIFSKLAFIVFGWQCWIPFHSVFPTLISRIKCSWPYNKSFTGWIFTLFFSLLLYFYLPWLCPTSSHLDLILGHQHIPILVVMKVLFFSQHLMCVRRKK